MCVGHGFAGPLVCSISFLGDFFNDGKCVHYLGGLEALSWIDRDKVSLPEILGRLQDHYEVTEEILLHWLFPRKELANGLRVLTNNNACILMRDCITDGCVADIYVDSAAAQQESDEDDDHEEGSDFEEQMQDLNCVEMEAKDDEVEVVGSKQNVGKQIVT